MTEDLTQDSLPTGLVEKSGLRTRLNEGVPACHRGRVIGVQALDASGALAAASRVTSSMPGFIASPPAPLADYRETPRSIRPQLKSAISRFSRPSVYCRLT
jgi:hypothetical protein